MISLDTVSTSYEGAVIKVIGIGGGGGNAINNMITKGLSGVEFIAANTDRQALEHNLAHVKVQVGKNSTKGLGAGANPEVGKSSIEESRDAIKQALQGSDMIFVTSGMGGGTGTGGAPLVAQIGQELGALVVAIVTKPFQWEGSKRMKLAEQWIEELRNHVDALIVISNQRLLEIIDKNTSFAAAFSMVDEVLYNATKGIAD
ncbi:MAG: cell division protein FtsZ, partial [Candidatus Kapaibacteriota bacterium]